MLDCRIGIIGAGWYGCHLGATLSALGFTVDIYEKNTDVLMEASGNNQFRLHLGFHYARHHVTRTQSRDGYLRFTDRYPDFSRAINCNLYAVASQGSLMDYATYRIIMTSTGIDFREVQNSPVKLRNISGLMETDERVLLISRARSYFRRILASQLKLGESVVDCRQTDCYVDINGARYDYVIDCSWGHFMRPPIECIYEPTLLLYYKDRTGGEHPAVTLVDGALCSVYPTERYSIYTLSSVTHTPLGRTSIGIEAQNIKNGISSSVVTSKRRLMEAEISHYLPEFRDCFELVGVQTSIKTKPIGASDDRSCSVHKDGRFISVMSGKIDTVFSAAEKVIALLERDLSHLRAIRVSEDVGDDGFAQWLKEAQGPLLVECET